jgi:hypothetical protein
MTRDLSQATVHPEKVKPSSAVSRWSMDDADVDSGTITDTWGSNDGTINGATTGATGIGHTGEAFSFDGSDDYVSPPNIGLTEGPPFTISVWVKAESTGNHRVIYSEDYTGDVSNNVALMKDSSDKWRFWVRNQSGTAANIYSSTFSTGKWYHLVAVNNGTMRLYVNGVEEGHTSDPGGTHTKDASGIGYRPNSNDLYFNGKIDEVRIYNTALTQQQIWKLYNIGRNANWGLSRS